jgi:hypothetical protein
MGLSTGSVSEVTRRILHKIHLIFDLQDHIYPLSTPVCYNMLAHY